MLAKCESALEEVTRIVSASGYQQNNPWEGYIHIQPPSFEFRQRFDVDTDVLLEQINIGLPVFAETNEILGRDRDWGIADIDALQHINELVKASPSTPAEWLSLLYAIFHYRAMIVNLNSNYHIQYFQSVDSAIFDYFGISTILI